MAYASCEKERRREHTDYALGKKVESFADIQSMRNTCDEMVREFDPRRSDMRTVEVIEPKQLHMIEWMQGWMLIRSIREVRSGKKSAVHKLPWKLLIASFLVRCLRC